MPCITYLHRLNGAHEIDQPRALKRALPLQVGSCPKKNLLYPFGLTDEFAANRKEGGNHTANMRRRHAGSAVLDVFACFPLCPILYQLPSGCRENFLTRSNDVGFHSSVTGRSL